jgi:hypothetical protein
VMGFGRDWPADASLEGFAYRLPRVPPRSPTPTQDVPIGTPPDHT